jgi:hypothetical protein
VDTDPGVIVLTVPCFMPAAGAAVFVEAWMEACEDGEAPGAVVFVDDVPGVMVLTAGTRDAGAV